MKYRHKTVPLTKVIISHIGVIEPLCNSCKTRDCEHLVEPKDVSVMGIKKPWRVVRQRGDSAVVVSCEGYSN